MNKFHIVFLTGAGISAESGLSTFRGKDGLWTKEEFQYYASTHCLLEDTQKCLDFYNWRRQKLSEVNPNEASIVWSKTLSLHTYKKSPNGSKNT